MNSKKQRQPRHSWNASAEFSISSSSETDRQSDRRTDGQTDSNTKVHVALNTWYRNDFVRSRERECKREIKRIKFRKKYFCWWCWADAESQFNAHSYKCTSRSPSAPTRSSSELKLQFISWRMYYIVVHENFNNPLVYRSNWRIIYNTISSTIKCDSFELGVERWPITSRLGQSHRK